MLKKILLGIVLLITIVPNALYANNSVSIVAENWFKNFSNKIDKTNTDESEIIFFKGFSEKLEKLKNNKKFTIAQISLINDLIKLSNERVFSKELKIIEKDKKNIIDGNKLFINYKNKSFNKENIILENGIWYTYSYEQYLSFSKGAIPRQVDLDANGIKSNESLVIVLNDNSIGFVNNYTKIKLVSDDIIYGIPGKYNFLKELKDDKKKIINDSDSTLAQLKNISQNLTSGKNKEEKIKVLYNYVLENVKYSNNFSLSDAEIFSGIETFKNKDGVCEGYVKMLLYMLNFSGIDDINVIRGYVIDAQDFPQVGHAWLRIGDNYYDPTFDDPIGQNETRVFKNYKYFNLPKDLFYTNRYDFDSTPENIKETNLNYRENLIIQNIKLILEKYKDSNYNILKEYLIKYDNGIIIDKKLDIEDFKKIVNYYEVNNFQFTENGKIKKILKTDFFVINTDTNIEALIEQLEYNLDGKYLFKWKLENGSYEYRLAHKIIFN